MIACVDQFASYANVLESALDMIDDNISTRDLDQHGNIAKILDAIMEVNVMLVYRFQCGPVSRKDIADVRQKVKELSVETMGKDAYPIHVSDFPK